MDGHKWSGLVQSVHGVPSFVAVAHGQPLVVADFPLPVGSKAMIYNWQVSSVTPITLTRNSVSQEVQIPDDVEITYTAYKEVCAGIGGIGLGANLMGMQSLASMDLNFGAVEIMKKNGVPNAILGDIQNPLDRWALHSTPYAARCWLMSGFPCQPLSTQGDQRGDLDPRSIPFFSMVKMAWEQQTSAIMLECVPNAGHATYVQTALQQLAYSLGMELLQTTLQLHNAWPCRRHRWWAIIAPKAYQPTAYLDLPHWDEMKNIVAFFPQWPSWSAEEEGLLALTQYELQLYDNKIYGQDVRHLENTMPCPCILHSYGSVFQACPCGCRSYPFSLDRLAQGGLRGFYVRSSTSNRFRYLHVSEAAVLCGFPPRYVFTGSGRDSLCYIGQAASPVQSLWMLAQFFKATYPTVDPSLYLSAYVMHIMKEIHGSFLFRALPAQVGFCRAQGEDMDDAMICSPLSTIGQWKRAEQKLQGWGHYVQVLDEQGVIPDAHYIQTEPLLGHYTVVEHKKKQVAAIPDQPIQVSLAPLEADAVSVTITPGTFLFELLDHLGLDRSSSWYTGIPTTTVHLDDRLWYSQHLSQTQSIIAGGQSTQGLGNQCLDWMAKQILSQRTLRDCWIPALAATKFLFQQSDDRLTLAKIADIQHGPLWTCVALAGHWILLCLRKDRDSLHVHCWNGTISSDDSQLLTAVGDAGRAMGLQPVVLHRRMLVAQTTDYTCGTVALLHLGLVFGLWTMENLPSEIEWHDMLCSQARFNDEMTAAGSGGKGKGSERDVIWALRDVLQEHGVPDERTEERATLALSKMGTQRIQEALASRNVWAALKALGSQPRINFLWVKADELEAQIRKKGQAKFKVQSSNKKQNVPNRTKVAAHDLDPSMLSLVPGSFVLEDDTPVTQISMNQIQAHRAGVAYGTVDDARPFLQEDKSISMDGLAILTTTRVPAEAAGLLPVTNLRYPALFGPTTEPLLLDGSLINLGDRTISRKQDVTPAPVSDIPTTTLKLMLFQDETAVDWNQCKQSPLRTLIANYPLLALCKGQRCGDACGKFHAPVDQDLDSVILDVWSRTWMSTRGRKVPQEEADLFQVFVRVPSICSLPLQRLSGQDGFYIEPRQTDGRGADITTTVVWIPQATLSDAQHKFKMQDRALAIARFGTKYGIRVSARDAEATHQELCPDAPFLPFDVQKVWELRPLPHGTQKNGLLAMLKAWQWTAKPLQPCRADATGMGWLVGSSDDPPSCFLPTDRGEVTVTLHKKTVDNNASPTIWSASKTQTLLRKSVTHQPKQSAAKMDANTKEDPWMHGTDPWGNFRPTTKPVAAGTNEDVTMHTTAMMDKMEDRLRSHLASAANELPPDPRVARLETDMAEIKGQNTKFEHWFQEAGTQSRNMRQQLDGLMTQVSQQEVAVQKVQSTVVGTQHRMEELTSQVSGHRSDVAGLQDQVTQGFAHIEALLSKKHRSE